MGPEHILGKSATVFHNYKHLEPICHISSTGTSEGEWSFLHGVFSLQECLYTIHYFLPVGVYLSLTHVEL